MFSNSRFPFVISANRHLQVALPGLIYSSTARNDGYHFRTSADSLRGLAFFLHNSTHFQFRAVIDIAVVDRLRQSSRFSVNYLLFSSNTNQRALIQVFAAETSTIPSLSVPFIHGQCIFASVCWLEREAWDMFGIYFSEHGDLRRILTDYGFTGHPLRKDYPLTGFYELVYSDAEGRVVSEPVELAQEFRVFNYA
jgi:NADH:ubiquinone oxidoreductase subunit C